MLFTFHFYFKKSEFYVMARKASSPQHYKLFTPISCSGSSWAVNFLNYSGSQNVLPCSLAVSDYVTLEGEQ